MGRSTASCLKMIGCGGDSVDACDSESKATSDKHGWSFRKRSARPRVLRNTVISETAYSGNKESPESATFKFQTQPHSSVPEKTSAVQWADDKPQLFTSVDSKVSETLVSIEDKSNAGNLDDEAAVIVIQSAIRGFLAQIALLKLQKVVKLQAAIRGHLVRRYAVGTLRCVQAIVKMQALVRARRARILLDSCTEDKEAENSVAKPNLSYTSIEKLLTNAFTRQLLESTPRTKPIHIKCDPLRSDSAWKWLERWMSLSSRGVEQSQKSESNMEHLTYQFETGFSSEISNESTNLRATIGDTVVPLESEDNMITYDATNFDFPDLISKPEMEREKPRSYTKSFTLEQLDTDKKKFGFGSRKVSNPAFIAAQSKFEELSSTAYPARSSTDASFDVRTSMTQFAGSECGTELSISSTLDSPDRSEAEVIEVEHRAKVSKESATKCLDDEAKVEVSTLEKLGNVGSIIAVDSSEKKHSSEKNGSDLQIEQNSETGYQAYKLSPESSPRSHITFPDSQTTPSSQVSVEAKRTKGDKSGLNPKRRSLSGGKRPPLNPNNDLGARTSLEVLPKDHKNGKRRNSFGSSRPDHDDQQEPRVSSSSNSLPSYMQVTESARAKAHANSSPRSSPDVQDKDVNIKKRQSLPGVNVRQGSPRIQRPTTQAQQGRKGNGSHLHEREWQR